MASGRPPGSVSDLLRRLLAAALTAVLAALPSSRTEWARAHLAEADRVPAGWARVRWLAGGLLWAIRDRAIVLPLAGIAAAGAVIVLPLVSQALAAVAAVIALAGVGALVLLAPDAAVAAPRLVTIAGVVAAALLVTYVVVRYPAAASGDGGPVYLTLTAVLLAGYALTAVLLTRRAGHARRAELGAVLRRGTAYGAAAGVLAWTAAVPFGGITAGHVWVLDALYRLAVLAVVVATAAVVATRTRNAVAGLWTGMVGALTLFLLGVGASAAFAGRLPVDSDVLAHRPATAATTEILGANVGETVVVYVLALVAGPLLGAVAGSVGQAIALGQDG
jgi:hypothetical protein